jgi:predicted N-acetyltransferase YhbS
VPTFRSLTADDVEEVVGLLGLLFAQEPEFTPDADRQRRALRAMVADPGRGVVLVAVEQRQVIGSVALLPVLSTALGGDVCWLEDFVVHPGWRGRGVGTALLRAAVRESEQRGWSRISVVTDHDNARARAMYAAAGFDRSGMALLRRTAPPPDRTGPQPPG